MSDQETGFCPPGPQHAMLQEGVGTWKVKTKFFMSPTGEPIEDEAIETVEAFGPFFVRSRFEATLFGMPFQGSATLGYEPHAERWVSTWIDSMMPTLFHFTGCFDEASKTMTMTGDGPSPIEEGKIAKYRTVEKIIDADHREFDMYVAGPDGSDVQMFHYVYERK